MPENDDIDRLKKVVLELRLANIAVNVRLLAFQDYAKEIWSFQGLEDALDQSTLRRMEMERADILLGEFADEHPAMASYAREYIAREFGVEGPRE